MCSVSTICLHTYYMSPMMPRVNCIVNDALVHAALKVQQAMRQFVNVLQCTHIIFNRNQKLISK